MLHSAHDGKVNHPADLYPDWSTFSKEVKDHLYAKYQAYAENCTKGGKGTKTGATSGAGSIDKSGSGFFKKLLGGGASLLPKTNGWPDEEDDDSWKWSDEED